MRPGIDPLWLEILEPRPDATFRLFCLPFGGSGASAFRTWPASMPESIEVCAIQLPGRENRIREPVPTDLNVLVWTLLEILEPLLDRPYAFYGHSMGALIGFELTRAQRRRRATGPVHLFVSSRPAPQLPPSALHRLSDEELLEVVRKVDGTPAAILANPKWARLFVRILKADIAMCEKHPYLDEPPLECPISVFAGREDPVVSVESSASWEAQTAGPFSLQFFPGGHFFQLTDSMLLPRAIAHALGTHPHSRCREVGRQ